MEGHGTNNFEEGLIAMTATCVAVQRDMHGLVCSAMLRLHGRCGRYHMAARGMHGRVWPYAGSGLNRSVHREQACTSWDNRLMLLHAIEG